MDRNMVILIAAGLLIAIVIAAVVLVLPRIMYTPESKTNSIGFHFQNLTGPGPLGRTQYADGGSFNFSLAVQPSDDCLLMALVDYRAVPFYYGGSYNTTHYLAGSLADTYSGNVSITNLSAGFHDVAIIGFVAPLNFSYDLIGWPQNLLMTGALRFNVIVNNSTKPVAVFENSSTAGNAVYRTGYNFSGPALFREPFDGKLWKRENVRPGEVLDYYLQVGHGLVNGKKLDTSYAVVQLLDYNQVPVRYNSSDDVYYGYIAVNESSSVHLSLKAPEAAGYHRLVVLLATDPYENIEIAPGVINTGITGSIRAEYIDLLVSG